MSLQILLRYSVGMLERKGLCSLYVLTRQQTINNGYYNRRQYQDITMPTRLAQLDVYDDVS